MKPLDSVIDFLEVDEVLQLHAAQIARFGGSDGLRDRGLLESAVAQARAGFGGRWLHEDVYAMAAAYWYHIVSNHAFVDGNKRAGLAAMPVFRRLNGLQLNGEADALYEMTIAIAAGTLRKADAASWLRTHAVLSTSREG